MIKIGFIVGKGNDTYPYKWTSKKAPIWLKNGSKQFIDFINNDNTVPSDVAMAIYIQYHYNDVKITLINGWENNNQKVFDSQDVIFNIYDAIEIFHCSTRKTCPDKSKKFEMMLNNTTAFVYPYPDLHHYIINKPYYYADLQKANIPIAPFFKAIPDKVINAPLDFKEKIIKKGWKGVIIKPSYSGYSMGIKVIKDISRTQTKTIKAHFTKLKEKGFPNAVVQEYVKSFKQNYEIRTYWINEQYAFSVGTLTEEVGKGGGLPISEYDTFKSEGGTINNKILEKLKPVAQKAIKAILRYPVKHPMIRVDFGCCLKNDNCIESYFINEIETMAANLLADHTEYPIVEKLGEAAYNFAKKVKGKKHLKGRLIPTSKLKVMPCKN
jgi:hypothetical protein